MTDTQLDPEMELEAQQLANYEDEQRELAELAEEVKAQNEDFKANKDLMVEWQKFHDEVDSATAATYNNWNTEWKLLKEYNINMFKYGTPWKSITEGCPSIVRCIEYGGIMRPLHITINEYDDGDFHMFFKLKINWFEFQASKAVDWFVEGVDAVNEVAHLFYSL